MEYLPSVLIKFLKNQGLGNIETTEKLESLLIDLMNKTSRNDESIIKRKLENIEHKKLQLVEDTKRIEDREKKFKEEINIFNKERDKWLNETESQRINYNIGESVLYLVETLTIAVRNVISEDCLTDNISELSPLKRKKKS